MWCGSGAVVPRTHAMRQPSEWHRRRLISAAQKSTEKDHRPLQTVIDNWPFVIVLLPLSRALRQLEKFKNKLEIVNCGTSWIDSDVAHGDLVPSLFLKKCLLMWFLLLRRHKLKELKIGTPLQSTDVCWNQLFWAQTQFSHIKVFLCLHGIGYQADGVDCQNVTSWRNDVTYLCALS